MTDIAGNRTLSSQWNETVQFYGNQNFLEYISVDDQLTSYTYSEFHYRVYSDSKLVSFARNP